MKKLKEQWEKIEGVERSCCIFNEQKGKLYGFYVGNIEKDEVIKYLKENLPVFMVPNKITQIEKFPITKNGKIDRKELAVMIKK